MLYFRYKKITDVEKINFLKSWIKPGDVTVDIGANTGFYTKLFSNLTGELGEVHSFEPDNLNYKILSYMSSECKNTYLNKIAVSNKNGFINLYLSTIRNTDHQTFDIGQNRLFKEVPCITIDKYFNKRSKKNISLIKLDIQGYDYYALLGMKNILKQSDRITILGELWPYALSKAGVNPLDYIGLLYKLGFKIRNKKFKNSTLKKEINNPYYFVDYIATKL